MKSFLANSNAYLYYVNTVLGVVLILSSFLYIYYVTAAVNEVVVRKDLLREIREYETEIAQLESGYMAAQLAISERIATEEHYQEVDRKIFVDRMTPSLVLGGATN